MGKVLVTNDFSGTFDMQSDGFMKIKSLKFLVAETNS